MIWHEHVSSIATAVGKKLGYLFRIRPSLEYCSQIWGAAAPTTLSILDAPPSRRRAVDDFSLFYRYSNEFCSSELTSIIPPLSKPKAVILHTSRTERYDRTFIPRVSRAWNGLPGDELVEPASVGLFKSRVNKLPLTLAYLSSHGTLVFRPCLRGLLSYKKKLRIGEPEM
nr:unnamed protein product [Callosobruchus chinensis]